MRKGSRAERIALVLFDLNCSVERRQEMPRGRPTGVRYFLDQISGNVVALGAGMMRVLQEIGGTPEKKVVRRRRRRRKSAKAATAAPSAKSTAASGKEARLGRPPGSKNKKKATRGRKKAAAKAE